MNDEVKNRLCLALDVDSTPTALDYVKKLSHLVGYFKVGLQLYVSEGPIIIKKIKELGGKVFLDLKFHDIPHTVSQVARISTLLGVDMFNIHATGSTRMMTEVVTSVQKTAKEVNIKPPAILAVTVLTSVDQQILKDEIKINIGLQEYVTHLASLSKKSGINGVVASPLEIKAIREKCGEDFVIVTPGIRSPNSPPDDQKRFLSPFEAIKEGANCIVVGRPIRNNPNPVKATQEILDNIEQALS